MRVIGRPELIEDARFSRRETRKQNRAALTIELEQALAAKSARDWADILSGIGVPAGPVLTVPEALALPQIQERELTARFEGVPGVDRPVEVVRAGFKMAGGDPDVETPPPALGAHTDQILQDLGYARDEIGAMRANDVV